MKPKDTSLNQLENTSYGSSLKTVVVPRATAEPTRAVPLQSTISPGVASVSPVAIELQAPAESLESTSVESSDVSQIPATSSDKSRSKALSPFHFNRTAFLVTGAAIAIIACIGIGSLLLTGFQSHKQPTQSSAQKTTNYATTSLPLAGVKGNEQLQVGEASQLSINGQLRVSNTLILTPTTTPSAPIAGQIYYNQATNAPYYYNGTQFVSLAPTTLPQYVSSLGGNTGSIGLGSGLQISGNQLAISSTLLQTISNFGVSVPNVTSLQGLTGDVTLNGGPGISVSGTTISNNGVLSVLAGSNVTVSNDGNGDYTVNATGSGSSGVSSLTGTLNQIAVSSSSGNVTLSLPQDIATSSTPIFNGLTLSSALGVADGGTGVNSLPVNSIPYGNGTGALQNTGSANDSVLVTGDTGIPSLSQTLPVQVQTNITQTGTLTAGAITAGFGNISTVNNITTTALIQGGSLEITGGNFTVDASGNIVTTGTAAIQGNNGLTLGVAGTTTGGVIFANASNSHFTTLQGLAPTGQDQTIVIPASTASTDTVCLLTLGNCIGAGSSVTSSGTQNYIPKFTNAAANVIGNSLLYDNGTSVGVGTNTPNASYLLDVNGNLNVAGSSTVGNGLTISTGGASITGNISQTGIGTFSSGTGTVTFNGTTSVSGSNTLTVGSGATTLGGTLGVTSLSTLSGGASISSGATITGTTNINISGTANTSIGNVTGTFGLVSSGLNVTTAGALSGITGYSQSSGNFTQSGSGTFSTGTGTVSLNGATTVTGTLTVQGSSGITIGVPGTTAGVLNLANGSNSNLSVIQSAAPTGTGTATYNLPSIAGGTSDTVCLLTLGNCSGASGAAGGDLSGTYPDPTIAKLQGTTLSISSLASGDLLQYNGSDWVNALLTNSNLQSGTFASITGTGALTSGSIGSGFGNINIGSNTFTGNGSGLADLNGSNITSGTVADSFLSSNVTLQGNTFNGNSELVQLTSGGLLPVLNGSNLTNLNGSNIASGTIANARLTGSGALTVTAGNGLSGGGSVALGGSTTLNVAYGSAANTAVQGSTALTCASGSGNLSGGGNVITLGAGGTCGSISITSSPTFTGTLTVQGSSGITIGVPGTTAGVLNLANGSNSNLSVIQSAAPTGTGTATYNLPSIAGGTSDTVCLVSLGNCAGSGGGVTGSGVAGSIAVFTGTGSIGDSSLTESGTSLTDSGNLTIEGTNSLALGTASANNGSIIFNNSTNGNTLTLQAGATSANLTFTLPTADGANGNCLETDGNGNLSFQSCTGGAGGGVTSLDTLAGVLTINNSSGSGSAITINDASTTQKGIAEFNSTNFSASSGTINTIQNISTSSSPVFVSSNDTTGVNTGSGVGTQRIDASGNLLNIGNLTLSGAISGGTTISGSGNINSTAGALQTAGVTRIDNSGNATLGTITSGLINGQTISSSASFTGTLTVQGSSGITIGVPGTTAGVLNLANGSNSNLSVIQSAAPTGTGTATYNLPSIAGGTSDTVCLLTLGNCSGASGAAGGDLSGTYPDPTIAKLQGTTLSISSLASGDLLQYNGSDWVNALLTNSNLQSGTFASITGTGALTSGSIGSGFGAISTGNNITTTAALQGATATLTGANALTLGAASSHTGAVVFNNASGSNTITLQGPAANPGGNYTLTIPTLTANANICTDNSVCNGYAAASSDNNYIQNGTSPQTANFDITGNGTVGGTLSVTSTINGATISGGTLSASTVNGLSVSSGTITNPTITGTVTGTSSPTITGFGTYNGQTISSSANFTGTVAIQGANALTLGAASSHTGAVVFNNASGSNTITLQGPAANPGGNYTLTIPTLTANDTVCTNGTLAAACSNYAPASGGNYIAKNTNDTSSASYLGNLLGLTNTDTSADGVLGLTNYGTNSALSITQSSSTTSEPSAGQALILANNATTTPTGNLIDLQNKGTSELHVDVSGNLTALGLLTSVGLNAQSGLIQGADGLTITGASVNLNASSNNSTNINTGSSTGAVNIGNTSGGIITLQSANAINLTAGAASTINFNGGSGSGGCTITDSTGALTCAGTLTVGTNTSLSTTTLTIGGVAVCTSSGCTSSIGGLAKNAQDTSSFAVPSSGTGDLYVFTNSSSAVASGVLSLVNGTNTNSTLNVTASGNPTSGQALIFASDTNATPSGNLLDLQSGSSPTSKFSVNTSGNVTAAGTYNTNTFNGNTLTFGTAGTATIQSASSQALNITGNAASTFSTSAGNLTLQAGSGTVSLGTSTVLTSSNGLTVTGGTTLTLNSTSTNAITLDSGTTGQVNVGTGNNSKTIQIGNTSAGVTDTIGIGNNATASSVNNITIGDLLGASTTTIQAGTGNINLNTNSSSAGVIVKTATNSVTAFQVQNTSGHAVLGVDTSGTAVNVGTAANGASLNVYGATLLQDNSTTAFEILQSSTATPLLTANTTNSQINVSGNVNVGTEFGNRLFSDGFESGNLDLWTTEVDGSPTITTSIVHSGKYAVDMNTTGSATDLYAPFTDSPTVYMSAWVYVASQSSTNTDMLDLVETNTSDDIAVYRNTSNQTCIWNDVINASEGCWGSSFTTGAWHLVQLRVTEATATTGTTQLSLDGTQLFSSTNRNNGTTPFQIVGIGEDNPGATSNVYYDDISLDANSSSIGDSLNVDDSLHVGGSSSFGNPVQIQTTSNSTVAFSVQNAAGTAALNVDTTDMTTTLQAGTDTGTATELFTSAESFPTTTGWGSISGTGSSATATHSATGGHTNALSPTPTLGIVSGDLYQVTYTVTSPNSGATLGVTMGGQTVASYSFDGNAITFTDSNLITATSTANLAFAPSGNFTGTISGVSVKLITGNTKPVLVVNNASGQDNLEVRASSSTNNIFVGEGAGEFNSSGTYNLAFGQFALGGNTSGGNNTALGNYTLANNTTGSSNTAVGINALTVNTSGSNNTALGQNALFDNTIGGTNVAVGVGSLESNTSGNSNTAVGNYALQESTTGYQNTAQGFTALQSNTTGVQNTAQGYAALQSNTTGSYNTALGIAALANNTTGTNNLAVGDLAGYTNTSANANVSGSGDTFIGADAGPGSTTQLQNATAIGANSTVNENNALTLGCVNGVNTCTASTLVGVDTATPGATLDVQASSTNVGLNVNTTGSGNLLQLQSSGTAVVTVTNTGATTLKNNSGTAFVVQNTSSVAALTVDTNNLRVDVGSSGTATGQLYVSGSLPTAGSTPVSTGSAPNSVFVQGNFAYVVNKSAGTLQSFDVSNPASPVLLDNSSTIGSPQALYVSGSYAYVVTNGGDLQIYNISDPGDISSVLSTTSLGGGILGERSIYVSGHYAYIANEGSSSLQIYDITNPAAPVSVGVASTDSTPLAVYVQGAFAYVVNQGSSTLEIYDVANPTHPVVVADTATGSSPNGVYVSGAYAYVANQGANNLQIFYVQDPTDPISTSTISTGTGSGPDTVQVQGRYAYVQNEDNNTIQTFDVSSPSSPASVGTVPTGTSPHGLFVQGRYAYVVNSGSSTIQSFNLGGEYAQQLEAGGISTGTLNTTGDAAINGDAYVQGGLNVGQSALVSGNLSVGGSLSGDVDIDNKTAETSAQTYTETSPDLGYYLYANSTTTNTTFTTTFNITGLSSTDGTVAFISAGSIKGTTSAAHAHTTLIEINGTTIATVATASQTAAQTVSRSFTVMQMNGTWQVVGEGLTTAPAAGTSTVNTADYAEWIDYSGDTAPQPGDVLTVGSNPDSAQDSTSPYASDILGVVSTTPYDVAGADDGHSVILALTGRVPVNVSLENGPIQAGDPLTSSSTPGVAMKATGPGNIIGTALESYDGTEPTAQVMVQLHVGYDDPTANSGSNLQGSSASTGTTNIQGSEAISGDLDVTGNATVGENLTVSGATTTDTLTVSGATTLGSLSVTGSTALSDLTVTGSATIASLHVTGNAQFDGDVTINGHVITGGGQPAVTIQTAAGTGATAVISGDDTTGTITIATGAAPTAGDLVQLGFSHDYTAIPHILLSGQNGRSAASFIYPTNETQTGFELNIDNLPQANTTYTFDYFIAQ